MSAKKARNRVGETAGDNLPPVSPSISPPIRFPGSAVRKRVVVERPAPPPVLRTCPYCGATFEDYTRRTNTLYCRPSCRVGMSTLKKRRAADALALATSVPVSVAADVIDSQGLRAADAVLKKFGYRFDLSVKDWVK